MKKHIVFLNWRDLANPRAGGAERLTETLAKELVSRGYMVTLLCAGFKGAKKEETRDGYKVVRIGTAWTFHLQVFLYWLTHLQYQSISVVVDQIHGIPLFTPLYIRKVPSLVLIHEVAGEIWDTVAIWPIGKIIRLLEPYLLRVYRHKHFLTVSQSTKDDLAEIGISPDAITIVPMPMETMEVPEHRKIPGVPTMIWIGRIAPVKQLGHALQAFAIAKQNIPTLQFWVVGSGDSSYVQSLSRQHGSAGITFFGKVSEVKKFELLSQATVLVNTSVKEGFGIVVLEAGACQVPTVAYNIAGIRDAVVDGVTGVLTSTNTPQGLADAVIKLIEDREYLEAVSRQAHARSQTFTVAKAVEIFEESIAAL